MVMNSCGRGGQREQQQQGQCCQMGVSSKWHQDAYGDEQLLMNLGKGQQLLGAVLSGC